MFFITYIILKYVEVLVYTNSLLSELIGYMYRKLAVIGSQCSSENILTIVVCFLFSILVPLRIQYPYVRITNGGYSWTSLIAYYIHT